MNIRSDSQGLTEDGERDDTLDFGFVLKPSPTPDPTDEPTVVPTPDPTDDPTTGPSPDEDEDGDGSDPDNPRDDGTLPRTGFSGMTAFVIGLLLMAGGAVLVHRARARRA